MKPFLFVALDGLANDVSASDVDGKVKTLRVVRSLSRFNNVGFKINLDYALLEGIGCALFKVREFTDCPIFVDLKMWNGGRTMAKIVEILVDLEVDYVNAYVLADKELHQAVEVAKGTKTKILGVTILTHYNDGYCQSVFGHGLGWTIRWLIKKAVMLGCNGVILPGSCLEFIRHIDIIKVVPGIRPFWYTDERHQQVISPEMAVKGGADILVCGSPIMKAPNPVSALEKILQEMNIGWKGGKDEK